MNEKLYKDRTARLSKFIALDAPPIITAIASKMVIETVACGRWKAVWWVFVHGPWSHHVGNLKATYYRWLFQLTGRDPMGIFAEEDDE